MAEDESPILTRRQAIKTLFWGGVAAATGGSILGAHEGNRQKEGEKNEPDGFFLIVENGTNGQLLTTRDYRTNERHILHPEVDSDKVYDVVEVSPDTKNIIITLTDLKDRKNDNMKVIDRETGNVVFEHALPDNFQSVKWSSDGRQVLTLHANNDEQDPQSYIQFMDENGKIDHQFVFSGKARDFFPNPQDPNLILIRMEITPTESEMKLMDLGKRHEVRRFTGWSASWSPDGKYIAREVDRDKNMRHELLIEDVHGSEVFYQDLGNYPVWAPDSRQIAFTNDSGTSITDNVIDMIPNRDLQRKAERQFGQGSAFLSML